MRNNARIDLTSPDIVAVLRQMGVLVISMSHVGRGFTDLLCACHGRLYLVEIKNGPLGWKYTDAQVKFSQAMGRYGVKIITLTSVDDAIAWVNGLRQMEVWK